MNKIKKQILLSFFAFILEGGLAFIAIIGAMYETEITIKLVLCILAAIFLGGRSIIAFLTILIIYFQPKKLKADLLKFNGKFLPYLKVAYIIPVFFKIEDGFIYGTAKFMSYADAWAEKEKYWQLGKDPDDLA